MIRSVAITKRMMDIIISLIVISVMFIPVIMICIAISIESNGFPIYVQRRMKKHQKTSWNDTGEVCRCNSFNIFKLRTMRKDAETGIAVNAVEDDPRITRIGKFLRKTRLDELPNFINVLLGDMSIVGPRADRYEIQKQVQSEFPLIFDRTAGIKPGITGWAQVELKSNGTLNDKNILDFIANGDYNSDTMSFRFKLYYDSAYAIAMTDFFSFLRTDLLIMLKTPIIMFVKRNTI